MLGGVFIFSGFVKAVDPLGSFYKIQDYLVAFGLISWLPSYVLLLAAILLAAVEFCVGVFLFMGMRRQGATLVALLLMLFMTPLTLYLAIADPVADCGCFGDAVVLTNWQTFGKNVLLLVAAVFVFKEWKQIVRFITIKMEWMISMYTMFFIIALSVYCLRNLPVLDFRPFKIGDPSAAAADEVPMKIRAGIVTRTLNPVQTADHSTIGKFIQNPIHTLPRHRRKRRPDPCPHRVHIRMRQVPTHIFIDRHPLRGAFPAVFPAYLQKFCVFRAVHSDNSRYLLSYL